MATTNHVRNSNIPLFDSTSNYVRGFWELTRAMKKAGWKYKASGNGSIKETTGNPASDLWNSSPLTTNAGAAAASIAAPTRGRATVTGLTGIVASDKGRFLLISGAATGANNNQHQIEEVLSSTSVRIDARNFAVASDANNGSLTWSIVDPTTALSSGFSLVTIAWWCAQGPSTLRVPITSASSGNFIRGENLVQSTTGAEGELVGYTFYNGSGWLVVAPRLRGTGAGAHGWDTANLVTGSKSGATVTQVGSATETFSEVVFYKTADQTNIQIFVQTASTGLLSSLATSAGCTAAVQPGGGGTGNAFPSGAWVTWGTNNTTGNISNISGVQSITCSISNAHVICVDAIQEQNYSADGSWSLVYFKHEDVVNSPFGGPGDPIISATLYGFHRLNDTEDGETSLYASISPAGFKPITTNSAAYAGTVPSSGAHYDPCAYFTAVARDSTTHTRYAGYVSNGTTFREFTPISLFASQSTSILQHVRQNYFSRVVSSANPMLRAREKVWLTGGSARTYKGSFRWVYWVNGGRLGDVFGTDPGWLQLSYGGGTTGGLQNISFAGGGSLIVGPHDGTPCLPNSAGG